MIRALSLLACVLLCGCGEPAAPTLHLTIKRDNGSSSVSRFQVFRTGRITESSDGEGVTQRVTIDKIADDGVTLTITLVADLPNAPAEQPKKQIFVPYGTEETVVDLKDATLTTRLERNKKK